MLKYSSNTEKMNAVSTTQVELCIHNQVQWKLVYIPYTF